MIETIFTVFLWLFCLGIIWILFEDFIFPLLKLFVFAPVLGVMNLITSPKMKSKFWLGSTAIRCINAVAIISLISLLMCVFNWEFLYAFLLADIIVIAIDVYLYSYNPELFD